MTDSQSAIPVPGQAEDQLTAKLVWPLLSSFFIGGIFFKLLFWKKAEPMTLGDLYFYQGLAQAFLARDWVHFWHFHFFPAYPVLMALFHKLTAADLVRSGRWLNILFDGLSVVPVYLLGKEIFNKRAGIFAGLFWSFCWPYHRLYGDPEPVYAFFILVALWLVLQSRISRKNYLAAAALCGFAALVKSEAVFFIVLLSLIYLVRSGERIRSRAAMLAAAAMVYLAFTSPIWIKYYQATGRFNPNPKSKTLFFIHNATREYQLFLYGLREDKNGLYTNGQRIYIEGDKGVLKTPVAQFIRENSDFLINAYFQNLKLSFGNYQAVLLLNIFPGSFLLVFLYLFRRKREFNFKLESWLWVWGVSFNLAVSLFSTWQRFYYPYFPVLVLVCGKGLDRMISLSEYGHQILFPQSPHRAIQTIVKWSFPALFILWFLSSNLYDVTHFKPMQPTANSMKIKSELAKDYKGMIGRNATIMCRGFPEPFTYFLQLPFWKMVIIPLAEPEEIIKYAREQKAAFIFIEGEDLGRNPTIEPWLWGEVKDGSLELIRSVPRELSNDYYPFALYEFLGSAPNPGVNPPR